MLITGRPLGSSPASVAKKTGTYLGGCLFVRVKERHGVSIFFPCLETKIGCLNKQNKYDMICLVNIIRRCDDERIY